MGWEVHLHSPLIKFMSMAPESSLGVLSQLFMERKQLCFLKCWHKDIPQEIPHVVAMPTKTTITTKSKHQKAMGKHIGEKTDFLSLFCLLRSPSRARGFAATPTLFQSSRFCVFWKIYKYILLIFTVFIPPGKRSHKMSEGSYRWKCKTSFWPYTHPMESYRLWSLYMGHSGTFRNIRVHSGTFRGIQGHSGAFREQRCKQSQLIALIDQARYSNLKNKNNRVRSLEEYFGISREDRYRSSVQTETWRCHL